MGWKEDLNDLIYDMPIETDDLDIIIEIVKILKRCKKLSSEKPKVKILKTKNDREYHILS